MHIIIIEDDKVFASNIAKKLEKNLYTTSIFNNAISFYQDKSDYEPDLYIVDLNLGKESWFDIIKYLRDEVKSYTPIIIMSGYNDTEKKVYWLDLWADDYVSKPLSPDELLARIRSVIRRNQKVVNNATVIYWNLTFDLNTKKAYVLNEELRLPKKENQILELFLQNKWKLVSKSDLIKTIWWPYQLLGVSDNTINATLSKLRKKLWWTFKLKTRVNEWYVLENE